MCGIKYQTKFFLYHTLIILLIILFAMGYFYGVIVHQIKKKEIDDFKIIVENTSREIDNIFFDMDKTALQIAANPYIVNIFQQIQYNKNENYFKEHPLVNMEIKKLLESYNFKKDAHARVALFDSYDDFVCTSNMPITINGIKSFFNSRNLKDVENYFSKREKFVYYKIYKSDILSDASDSGNKTRYISVVREIKDYFSNSLNCGYVEVQEPLNKIEEILNNVGKSINIDFMDNNKKILSINSVNNDKLYEMKKALMNAPYKLVFKKEILNYEVYSKEFLLTFVLSSFVLFVMAMIAEKILISYLTRPLVKLNKSLDKITMNNYRVEISDKNSLDIIYKIEDSFNMMFEKLNKSIEYEIAARTNEIKAEYFALQSQINPHFLHNMLAIISMESQTQDYNKIPEICQKLSEMLRYNTQIEDNYSNIGKELHIAENYMLLMKIRYEDIFRYKINIQRSTEKIVIPKLILQPLCENCFSHGFKNMESRWEIEINAWSTSNKWFIEILDNGSGFNSEFLENFKIQKDKIAKEDLKDVINKLSIGGLSIPNIYIRLLIEYGEDAVFELSNCDDGAVVLIGGIINVKNNNSRR